MRPSYWFHGQGAEVKRWRTERGMTQEQAARVLRVSLRTWVRWEHDEGGVPYNTQRRMNIGPTKREVA